MVVIVTNFSSEPRYLELETHFLDELPGINNVQNRKWHINVSLYNGDNVTNGDRIYITACFCPDDPSSVSIPGKDIPEGEWLFPVVVKAKLKEEDQVKEFKFILGQVSVKVTAAAPASAEKSASTKSQMDIHII